MPIFRAILFTAVLAGLIVGVAVSAVQFLGTAPLILKAEVYEKAGEAVPAVASAAHSQDVHNHDAGMAPHAHEQEHEEGGWEPADGFERNAYTVAANILTAIGYALALGGLIALRGRPVTWREGLLWGIAGFACVMLAPMLGLPPELPGTPAGPLADRQLWWAGTVAATAAGLGLIAFQRKPWAAAAAVLLIALPHLVGAPAAPDGDHGLAPQSLERQFVAAAVLTSLVFWSLLGSLTGALLRRFEA